MVLVKGDELIGRNLKILKAPRILAVIRRQIVWKTLFYKRSSN